MQHAIHRSPLAITLGMAIALITPSARADCFDDAAAYQQVNPLILRAIAWQESRNRPNATHLNANSSPDYGVMQINSIHLRELAHDHIDRDALMRRCADARTCISPRGICVARWKSAATPGPR